MAILRRRKSRKQRALDLLASYLKLKAVSKTAKGAGKAAKGTVAYKAAKKTPIIPAVPVIAGAGIAALLAGRKLKGGGGQGTPATA